MHAAATHRVSGAAALAATLVMLVAAAPPVRAQGVRVQAQDTSGQRALGDSVEARDDVSAARPRAAGWIELTSGGSRDSDGIVTSRSGATITSPAFGAARMHLSFGAGRAADPTASRGALDAMLGATFTPSPRLRLEIGAGAQRVDRGFIDTATVVDGRGTGDGTTRPGNGTGPGSGNGPGTPPGNGGAPGVGRPGLPIGVVPADGASPAEAVAVARARIRWRDSGDRVRIDARASRQLLDASPYLVAQGVRRDEAGAELDVRVAGPLRARAFGRIGAVHNEAERNTRHIVGGAIAWVPRSIDLSVRGQELSFDAPSGLAYFAPRYVRSLELTSYVEREIGDLSVAVDAGIGTQQVAGWTEPPGEWSPAMRLWFQVVRPLSSRFALGVEGEGYDAGAGTSLPTMDVPEGRWWYGSLRAWLRAGM